MLVVLVTVEDVAHVEDVKVEVVGEGDMVEGWSRGLRDPQGRRDNRVQRGRREAGGCALAQWKQT